MTRAASLGDSLSGSREHSAPLRNEFLRCASASSILLFEEESVLSYLEQHPDLCERLPSVLTAAREEFQDAELSLAVYRDPETDDHFLTLTVRKQTGGPPLMRQIDRFCDRYESVLQDLLGFFLITTDFRSPGSNNGL